jgi:hypothetical protein
MTIIATCGHEIPDNSDVYSVILKDYTRECRPCISSVMFCLLCQELYYDDILDNEEEEQAWLHGEGTA